LENIGQLQQQKDEILAKINILHQKQQEQNIQEEILNNLKNENESVLKRVSFDERSAKNNFEVVDCMFN